MGVQSFMMHPRTPSAASLLNMTGSPLNFTCGHANQTYQIEGPSSRNKNNVDTPTHATA